MEGRRFTVSKYMLGIDLGGTNIRVGLFDEEINLIRKQSVKTPKANYQVVIRSMVDLSLNIMQRESVAIKDITALGIAAPGSVNNNTGKVLYANNLGWTDVSLRNLLLRDLPLPIYLENDANVAALAEAWLGANRGMLNSLVITLGTGVGSGVLTEGKILHGNNYAGGELGHMVVIAEGEACTCGRRGCWEAYSSAPSLLRMAKAAMQDNETSALWEACEHDLNKLLPEQVFDLSFKGDAVAKAVIERYMFVLKQAVVNLVNIFQPEQIAIGGGIGGQGERLTKPLQMAVNIESYGSRYLRTPKVVSASLGNDAGLYGAALLPKYYEGGIHIG